jgi:hypothetical protein
MERLAACQTQCIATGPYRSVPGSLPFRSLSPFRVRRIAKRGGNVPAIALTAYARAEDRMKAILAGFQMHVAKPVEGAELLTMVASLAGRTPVS